MAETKAFTELKVFLNKLFQFESQDLDFGIYKILHYKRDEINKFIHYLLRDKVLEQFQVFDQGQQDILRQKLDELAADEIISNYNRALSESPEEAQVFRKYDTAHKISNYLELKKQYETAVQTAHSEETVYNHLTQFFSRYYDKGDFISKRRFGKSEKYVVPYNGEETYFYWANHDQYYIKSSEFFQQFSFKIPMLSGTLTVHFKLAEAQTEQGNVKASENRYFVLSKKPALKEEKELSIYFEYRPLTEEEKKSFTGNNKQDILNELAAAALKTQFGVADYAAELWKEDENGQNLLLKKLHHYTRKNSYDFFIHKDLKGFFQRELDFYIKSELVQVEDLYVLDSERHFENIKHNFKLIKCFKNIADTLIDFLAQIEDFQKKLWEKKKFVLNTEWVISIDKLAGWLPAETLHSLLQKVLANPAQVAEWKELFGWKDLPFALTLDGLKADLHTWRKLPVDTKHFEADFKDALLNALSAVITLEEEANGLVIHSDNYHGLKLLEEKFKEKINCIYIDPPYNTGNDGFVYKDKFRHSSWIAFLGERILRSKELLNIEGASFISIDDWEHQNLNNLLGGIFGDVNKIETIIWKKRNTPPNDKLIGAQHEYIDIYGKDISQTKLNYRKRSEERVAQFKNPDNHPKGPWTVGDLTANVKGGRYVESLNYPITNPNTKEDHYPGVKGNWRFNKEKIERLIASDELYFGEKGLGRPKLKRFLCDVKEGITYTTLWDFVPLNTVATNEMTSLFKDGNIFENPKPSGLIREIQNLATSKESIVLDYFPGSGTTFHSTLIANKDDNGFRKCFLIEQGQYVYSLIIPRIKKIGYSFEWKDGSPLDIDGSGIFLKYQRLEQYEESLENIAFTANKPAIQQAMQFDQYLPKYFLEMETRESHTLVNLGAMQNPWAYELKVWDGFTYDTQQAVDLVETFNYIVGLHVQKWFTTERDGLKYVGVWGYNNDEKRIWVIWRNTTGWKEADYDADKAFIEAWIPAQPYELLFVNHQCTVPGSMLTEEVFKTQMIPA